MSLDVYLIHPSTATPPGGRIYVRRDGRTVEVTRAEWDEMYPGRVPVVVDVGADEDDGGGVIYEANITHNLGRMAAEVGLYEPLWRPGTLDATRAADIIERLRDGLARLVDERERLQEFNPSNGWGSYDVLVQFTVSYLAACERWPDAEIRADG